MEEQLAEKESTSLSEDEVIHQTHLKEANKQRARQELELQRENILGQRTSNPHRRAALESALVDIESRLNAL
ncbi:MAG TPA: hypothetical protein VMU92_00495 [Acidobacteriaceae bacterium]|nr:hypothetical protein [Acidobacteriaceae bacterium]